MSRAKTYYHLETEYFFKSPYGVSGYGFWSNKKNTLEEIIEGSKGERIIIERVIEKIGSPSIQFCIGIEKEDVCIFGFTDQILEGGQHYMGNESPSRFLTTHPKSVESILSQSEKIIEYVRGLGYKGFGGIDFMIDESGEVYATEVNARFTGATYPAITTFFLTDTLDAPWKYESQELDAMPHKTYIGSSYKNGDTAGVFPLCIGGIEDFGKIQVLTIN